MSLPGRADTCLICSSVFYGKEKDIDMRYKKLAITRYHGTFLKFSDDEVPFIKSNIKCDNCQRKIDNTPVKSGISHSDAALSDGCSASSDE